MRPNEVGPKSFFLNHLGEVFTSGEFAAIDTPFVVSNTPIISPYAYTSTVRTDYDGHNFFTDYTLGCDLIGLGCVSFGLFLTPENDKPSNLLFQVAGRASWLSYQEVMPKGNFFFGRKATNNTVVSSKAAPSNQLAAYSLLPSKSSFGSTITAFSMNDAIESDLFSLRLDTGFVYCFGYTLENHWVDPINVHGGVSLSFRKFSSELRSYDPSRM